MKKNILVIDDSALMRRIISDIIAESNDYQVIQTAQDGLQALEFVIANNKNIDAILLDLNMPKMGGLEFLSALKQRNIEQQVIVVSTLAREGAKETIRSLELGALDFVTKPDSFIEFKGAVFKQKIIDMLDMATSHRKLKEKPSIITPRKSTLGINKTGITGINKTKGNKIVALACSTGGPRALQFIVPYLPKNLNAPVTIVQHMPVGFTLSLANRLNELSEIRVKEAEKAETLEKGTVYIAKGGLHLEIKRQLNNHILNFSDLPSREGVKPCANYMYESLADSQYDEIVCVVLTGMGADGTAGIKNLNEKKDIYVIAQDQATSTVYGMPRVIAEAGLVNEILPLKSIAGAIINKVGVQ